MKSLKLYIVESSEDNDTKLKAKGVYQDSKGNFFCDKDLSISYGHIDLPNDLTVNGTLHATSNTLTTLPDNLKVNGMLNISSSSISEIPKSTVFTGGLNLIDSKVSKFPSHIKDINGDLRLNALISKLPSGLTVKDTLKIFHNRKLSELPSKLSVGSLYISYTDIKKLPTDLKLDGSLTAVSSKLENLPDNLLVNGDLNLYESAKLTSLPNGLKVLGNLDIRKTGITELPKDLSVTGKIRKPKGVK